MPLIDRMTVKITDWMPSIVSHGAHEAIDYAASAAFLVYGLAAWERDKRVAVSSAGCGLFHLLTSAVTDYAELRSDRLGMGPHARIDIGVAAMAATMPGMMGIKDKYDARFFRVMAIVIAGAAGLTDFRRTGENRQIRRIEEEMKRESKAA